MPIYMDRHDVSEDVTAEVVAKLHHEDLKIQHNYSCKGLTYWFDDVRKTAFCLIEAPDKQSLTAMHKNAHGEVPNQVIEVDANIVESFLGRIEDPENFDNTELNIINEPAFRIIMAVGIKPYSFHNLKKEILNVSLQKFNLSTLSTIKEFNGNVVNHSNDYFMVSFKSVSEAIKCALKVKHDFLEWQEKNNFNNIRLKTGVSAGSPVTNAKNLFDETVKTAERLHHISMAKIMITNEIKELYQNWKISDFVIHNEVEPLHPDAEKFMNQLMDKLEDNWTNSDFHAIDLCKALNISKSKLYRKTISLTGKSPNTFIKDFRLNRALRYFRLKKGNISEIAYETGFGSPSYFTKCFQKKYGIKPTEYLEFQEN
jgi:AraC-like DNA-binding protein